MRWDVHQNMSDTLFSQAGSDESWPSNPHLEVDLDSPTGAITTTPSTKRREELHRPGFPVIEVFGPVVQGEGPAAGRPCYFVRFGGCDYRCSWCDSMYAVDPEEVREHAVRMTSKEILDEIKKLPEGPGIVILSGGNPALHDLTDLVRLLQTKAGLAVHVETQGSVWRPWLSQADKLIISPKPPSSGMVSGTHTIQLEGFMGHVYAAPRAGTAWCALKVVVAGEDDYLYASDVHTKYPEVPFYLSVMTPQEIPFDMVERVWLPMEVGRRYKWLCERAQSDSVMSDAVILPQLHVIAHGAARGV